MKIRIASINTKWWPFLRSSASKGHAQEKALEELVRGLKADIIGLQEVPFFRMEEFTSNLNERGSPYAFVGRSRSADGRGEGNPILYRSDVFEEISSDTHWISKHPFEAGSRDWHSALPRTITWAHFKHKETRRIIHVINTHLDHISLVARRKGAMMLCGQVEHLPPEIPVVVMGDFNATERSVVYKQLSEIMTDARTIARNITGPAHTCVLDLPLSKARQRMCLRIDYLFLRSPHVEVEHFGARECIAPYASDHLPLVADVTLE